jgi:hypothetical protein
MLQIRRSFYNMGVLSGTDAVAAAISGGTLISGDVLLYNFSQQIYGTIVGNALVLAKN